MWPYIPDLLATPVPRYTSFPTAAEFTPGVDFATYDAALAGATGDVSLYVHIPFCESICWYCGCNTGRAGRRQRLASYLDALHREIALVGSRLPATARVRRIAFGGGSPNAIAPTDFVRLLIALTQSFRTADPIISIELDPRLLDAAWCEVLQSIGVARASLGVQTFDPTVQQAIGRVQPAALIAQCSERLRKAGVSSLNFDLMYGLPGQDRASLAASLARATVLEPERIALFGYAHVPQLMPRQRRIDRATLPDAAERFMMAASGHERLVDAGYGAVGFDHFALPGDPLAQAALGGRLHRNFQGFTDDDAPALIGLGASAISSFPELLVQNQKNAGRYRMMLSQNKCAVARSARRSRRDRERGAIIAQLLCHGRARVGVELLAQRAGALEPFAAHGLVRYDDGQVVLAAGALPYARAIAAVFDPYRQPLEGGRFSAAV